jgi:polypeptide N-acetylgalactosaminyltransferase
MVRILKSPTRLGLMKARLLGAMNAKAEVLVVMDSHVEVAKGWLPPLLDPIKKDPKVVTMPAVETLNVDDLSYKHVIFDKYPYVGGFTWKMMYTWVDYNKPNRSEEPLPTPTMLGAAFVIRKDYFEYLGYYDDGFELWGGENLELSFKVWMCGGKMYQAMCSHLGHMFRARPYWVIHLGPFEVF